MPKNNTKNILVYEIKINENFCNNLNIPPKYQLRLDYYNNNRFISINNLSNISRNDIYFDCILGFISLKEHTRHELLQKFGQH